MLASECTEYVPLERVYTRQEILDAIALHPCHVTGLHDPNHTVKEVCSLQQSASFTRLLEFLGITVDEVPRKLHDNCYWCHGDSERRARVGELRRWAERKE